MQAFYYAMPTLAVIAIAAYILLRLSFISLFGFHQLFI